MRRSLLVALCFGLWTLISAPLGFANGVFQSVSGDVRAAVGTAAPASVARNQRVVPGSTVTTGPGAQTVIRFDDGHTVVLNENTEFRVNQYSFDKDKPQSDNIAIQLLKGAMRSVSGLIGSRSRNSFALLAPQATIGIRGTDFMVALVNPAYFVVLQGTIEVSNAAGSVVFSAGEIVMVESSTTLPVRIPSSALPPSVANAFSSLGAVAVAFGPGANEAVGAGAGGLTPGQIAAALAAIGIVVIVTHPEGGGTTGTTTTTPR